MSSTRIVFMIVCAVVAVLVTTMGIIIQRNNPDSKYSVKNALGPKPAGIRRKKLSIPKNPTTYLTVFLVIVLLFLYLVFSGK